MALRDVEVGDEGDAEPVVEGDLPVIDAVALGKVLSQARVCCADTGASMADTTPRSDARPGQLQEVPPPHLEAGLRLCDVPSSSSAAHENKPTWRHVNRVDSKMRKGC